jgi:DNA-binding LacI/PurR family transcriptional regulator
MPQSVPRPESLVQRTADVLREQIRRGLYGEALPGEPRLASGLMVSRGTLRAALALLTAEGLISPGHPGARRAVLAAQTGAPGRSTRTLGVLLPQPLDSLSAPTQQFFQDLSSLVAANGVRLSYHASVASHRQKPGRLLRAVLAEHPADLWLIYEASKPMVAFFKAASIPVVVCGGPGADETVSHCAFDGVAAQRHAIGVFARAGHTRIVTATRFARPLREEVTREEFERRGWAFDPAIHMPVWNNEPERLRHLLRRRLSGPDRPTAWLINSTEGLLVFFSTLMELGLRIPDDVSVLTIGSEPVLECFRPAIGHYATPHRALARAMAGMIRTHLEALPSRPMVRLLQTEYVRGGSVGPAPG